ncbi:MAG: hypothetical protein EXR12_13665 [Rhodospirillaceae bacterium]|nr:hypothetical protein [Rhodospirillaceae bacterium]
MTKAKRIATIAASLVLGTLTLAAMAGPASARWWGDGRWHDDNRWDGPRDNNQDRYYNGYYYRPPPVVYGTPYNYGYAPPPVYYDNTLPGFTIRIQ